MASKKKQPTNTWIEQVINPGIDKTIPLGAVDVVYSKKDGSPVGFMHGGQFYNLGDKLPPSIFEQTPSDTQNFGAQVLFPPAPTMGDVQGPQAVVSAPIPGGLAGASSSSGQIPTGTIAEQNRPTGMTGPTTLTAPLTAKTPPKSTGSSGSPGGGSSKNTKPAKPMTQAEAYANFRSKYPDEAAIIDSDPSLKALFQKAMGAPGGAWAPEKFQQEYESSSYYQTHSDAYRNAEQARLGHGKGSYADAYNNALDNIKQYAIETGITIDPSNLGIDPKGLDQSGHIIGDPKNPHPYDAKGGNLVDDILHKYWDTGAANKAAIVRYLASKGTVAPDLVGGQAQQNVEQLKNWANDLGLNDYVLSKGANYFNDAASSIAKGKQDINFFHQDLMNQAASRFPIYAKQIAAGLSVRSVAAPYINTMANLLETTPDNIDLSAATGDGATVRKALQGNGIDTPTSLTDFETQVRQDPRWGKTLNAQNSVEATAHKILTDFGVAS